MNNKVSHSLIVEEKEQPKQNKYPNNTNFEGKQITQLFTTSSIRYPFRKTTDGLLAYSQACTERLSNFAIHKQYMKKSPKKVGKSLY